MSRPVSSGCALAGNVCEEKIGLPTTYNSRSLRGVRLWIANNNCERWSTKILRLQFQLVGHWGRQHEGERRGLAARMLLWRCQKWWTAEQAKGQTLGKRHPGRFRAGNTERSIANVLGVDTGLMLVPTARDGNSFCVFGFVRVTFPGLVEDRVPFVPR